MADPMAALRVGTSGWVYPHWRGLLYPLDLNPRLWLACYAQTFDSVEVNNTFYRLPSPETFSGWKDQTPDGFLFAIKANRFITHLKKLKDPEPALAEFVARTRLLGGKQGPILYQLPPRWGPDLPRFEHFLDALPAGYVHVIEFREQGWFDESVFRLMERLGVVHCIHDMRPLRVPLRVTGEAVYLRFHGSPMHGGDYPLQHLVSWAARIERWLRSGHNVYAYFNNDIGGFAVGNAQALRQAIFGASGVNSRRRA